MLRPRTLAAALGGAALTVSLALMASPVVAADSLRITSPLSGTVVSGDMRIEGTLAGLEKVDLTLAIAPQTVGECGPAVATAESTVQAGEPFAAVVDTTQVADGLYCIVAVADGGALSDVQGDVTIRNEVLADGQLPTLALPEDAAPAATAAIPQAGPVLAAAVLVLAAIAALGVAAFGVIQGRKALRRS